MVAEDKKEPVEDKRPIETAEVQDKKEGVFISTEELNRLKEKEKLAEEYYDKLLRLQAEVENFKKRITKEKEEFIKFANEELIVEILPVLDNLERALDGAHDKRHKESIKEGVKLIQKQLTQVIKKFGVEYIEAVGKKFDPEQHEAIVHVESDKHPEGIIIEELQKGYTIKQRLIRPSVVKIAVPVKPDTNQTGQETKT